MLLTMLNDPNKIIGCNPTFLDVYVIKGDNAAPKSPNTFVNPIPKDLTVVGNSSLIYVKIKQFPVATEYLVMHDKMIYRYFYQQVLSSFLQCSGIEKKMNNKLSMAVIMQVKIKKVLRGVNIIK